MGEAVSCGAHSISRVHGIMPQKHFLQELPLRPVTPPDGCPYRILGLAVGSGASALEVLIATNASEPRLPDIRSTWHARQKGRAAPLLLVVRYGAKVTLCGPTGDDPPIYRHLDEGQAERLCRHALSQPDRHAVLRWLRDALPSVETNLPGLRNEGFLATHELESVRQHRVYQWDNAVRRGKTLLKQQGETVLKALGFTPERLDQATEVLRAGPAGEKNGACDFAEARRIAGISGSPQPILLFLLTLNVVYSPEILPGSLVLKRLFSRRLYGTGYRSCVAP